MWGFELDVENGQSVSPLACTDVASGLASPVWPDHYSCAHTKLKSMFTFFLT